MAVHIGNIIRELIKKRGLSVTGFADDINYSRRNVYDLFERESIDTALLDKIGKVLGENLFWHYIPEEERAKQAIKQAQSDIFNDMLDNLQKKLKVVGEKRKREKIADTDLELHSKGVRSKKAPQKTKKAKPTRRAKA